jgi:hypothetical protein
LHFIHTLIITKNTSLRSAYAWRAVAEEVWNYFTQLGVVTQS